MILISNLIDSPLQAVGFMPELSSDIDVGGSGSHRETNNQGSLHELMRVISKYFSILASSWLGFIGIDNKV